MLLGTTSSPSFSITLWLFAAMGMYAYYGPFWSLPNEFLTGFAAASSIALINSIANLGGFVGPSVIGALANGAGGIYRGLAVGGVALFLSAALVLLLPRGRRSPARRN